jgi:hypothetical protein
VSRRLVFLLVALIALAGAGCGNKKDEIKLAENEGLYVDLGGLKYQVEMSRQLNPADVEDHSYLTGVPRQLSGLAPGDSWFAVFVRVENNGEKYLPAADSFVLRDTRGNTFTPVPIARTNPFSYHGGFVAPKNTLPPKSSVAQANESIGGALVLFRVPVEAYANRPLELTLKNPRNPRDTASVELDV